MKQNYADIEKTKAHNKQRRAELHILQSLPLQEKILITQRLINETITLYGEEHVYLSFSGGKDSTVLSHIACIQHPIFSMYLAIHLASIRKPLRLLSQ